jgi:hypothetical protein
VSHLRAPILGSAHFLNHCKECKKKQGDRPAASVITAVRMNVGKEDLESRILKVETGLKVAQESNESLSS